ncbi:MAG: leucyl aminopeptidase family protein [Chromatiales bacterium]|nr:MAG: leucyl aminopeptidase family protein [Chromatiales bacterium]
MDHVIVVLPHKPTAGDWKAAPGSAQLRAAARRAEAGAVVHGRLDNKRGTGLSARRLPAGEPSRFELLSIAGELVAAALADQPRSLALLLPGLKEEHAQGMAEALLLAAHAHAFNMPEFKAKQAGHKKLGRIRLLGLPHRLDLKGTEIAARAQNLARWLTALPPNRLDAPAYRTLATALARQYGWKTRWLGESQLRKADAGAFLAVCQGNASRDAGILHLRYQPAKPGKLPPLALVGKGILFDTGGNNLKPHKSMLGMHEDMAGSAVALATLQALTESDYPRQVDCWLAITENRISAAAYKPRDVVTASNGVTIEVIHTDAEGRLVLADTLALAGREQPSLIIDYATLTGACVYSLTERYSGVFANRDDLHESLVSAGRRSGERVWPFPLDKDYDDALKSTAADVLQCSTEGSGDHILAARFLKRFVPDSSDWVHMDLSAASRKQGLAQVPGGATGFGVRWTLEFLQAGE